MLSYWHSLRRGTQWAILLWGALLLAISGRVLFTSARSHTVYPIYLLAAESWQQGSSLYWQVEPGFDVYRYHPLVAAAFVPWDYLPEKLGGWLWRALNVFVFLIGFRELGRWLYPERISGYLWVFALPLCLHSLNNAQANLLLVGLMMLGIADHVRGRQSRAALWLALATILKCYPIVLAMLLMLMAPRRFGYRFLGWLLLGWCLPFLLQQPTYVLTQYRDWFDVMRLDDRLSAPLDRCTRDLFMVCRVWWMTPTYLSYRLVQVLSGLAIAVWVWRRQSPRLAFDLGMLWMVLLGPATEACTYTLLAPTLAMQLARPTGACLLAALIFGYATIAGALPRDWRFDNAALPPIAGLCLMMAVVMDAIREQRGTATQEKIGKVGGRALVEAGG